GLDAAGMAAIGNHAAGVVIAGGASNNLIGGTAAGAGNFISGNPIGVRLDTAPFGSTPGKGNVVQGNWIGTADDKVTPVPNTSHGNSCKRIRATTGGTAAGEANRIVYNGGAGVYIESGTGNTIRGNSIYANTGLGIDLAPPGVTPNDLRDPDSGANNLLNYPV